MAEKKWFIGINADGEREFLKDFSWDCGWYWSGGYLGNKNIHHHFSGLSEKYNTNMRDAFLAYYKGTPLTDPELWRLCDLFKQFYAYKEAAECFQYGGHYTSTGRTPEELKPEMAQAINAHIENVIIPEIRKLMDAVTSRD